MTQEQASAAFKTANYRMRCASRTNNSASYTAGDREARQIERLAAENGWTLPRRVWDQAKYDHVWSDEIELSPGEHRAIPAGWDSVDTSTD